MKFKKPFSCGLGPAFAVIGGRWKADILWELHYEPVRFAELHRRLPEITEKMLMQQLKEMESHGLVYREVRQLYPSHVEYSLTERGHQLNTALDPLAEWGKRFAEETSTTEQYRQ